MRQIVDGKRYDTATAECIGIHSSGASSWDANYLLEGLFRTPNGVYFIAGEGGSLSKYAVIEQGITPLSREEAFAWAQKHLEIGDFEEHFADLIADA